MNTQLTLSDRKEFISNYPLFSLFDAEDIEQLASIIEEKLVDPGFIITKEGDVIDAIYFIFSGTAKVTQTSKHITFLEKGSGIGLSESGFYSKTGIRSATVIAETPMILGKIDLAEFNKFIHVSGIPYHNLKNVCEKILLMNFLEDTHLFTHVPKIQLEKIAKRVDRISLPANQVLFNQGDLAETCYFIISGQLIIKTKNSEEHILATLEEGSIIGEGAFLDNAKRNATAIAKTDCSLFVLKKSYLKTLETDTKFVRLLNKTRIGQLKPSKTPNVTIREKTSSENEAIIILTHPENNSELCLSHNDFKIWEELDGKKNISTLKNSFSLNINELYSHLLYMKQAGFVEVETLDITTSGSWWSKLRKLF
jgi:CRP-like cAMP-binding protein